MKKSEAKRLLIAIVGSTVVVFVGLIIAGKSVGNHPLPWHVPWMVPLGKTLSDEAFHLSIRNGWDKSKVRQAIGDPGLILIGDRAFEHSELKLEESRPKEMWTYPSPHPSSTGWVLTFERNILIGH